MLIQKIKK